MEILNNMKYVVGIDEAGRGPLAGPVTVGAFIAEKKMEKWLLKNIFDNRLRDSKKLSPKKREEIYKKFLILKKTSRVFFSVSHISNKIIDKQGISKAIQIGINKSLQKLHHTSQNSKGTFDIRLDGLLKAPKEYKNQKTIIKGDEKNVFIACASIVAKVSRDRLMCRLIAKYPHYALEIHKGYGTKLHYSLLQKHGLSSLHRKSFCQKL
ncbi:MAG: ribonuclease HII [Patescibacteria group bacterium]